MSISNKRKWSYTIGDIEAVTRRSARSIRDDRQKGVFDPESFRSVIKYVSGFMQIREASVVAEEEVVMSADSETEKTKWK